MARWTVHPEQEPSTQVQALAEPVQRDGGRALALYRDPVGGPWQIFCPLPRAKVEPTPSHRDLSPTHVKRLQEVVRKLAEHLEAFELSRVRYEDIQRAGLMASAAPA